MSIQDAINAQFQIINQRVWVDGVLQRSVTNINIDHSFDSACGSATIEVLDTDADANAFVEIEQGYNGYFARTFTGWVDVVEKSNTPGRMAIRCRDVLKWAVENFIADEIEYNQIQAQDLVQDLIVNRSGITGFTAETSNFTVADIVPAKFIYTSAYDAAKQVAELIRWRVWADATGTVHFEEVRDVPASDAFWSYSSGDRILKISYELSDEALRNYIKVKGYGSDIWSDCYQESDYVPSPPTYRTAVLSSELIDTQEMADFVAQLMLDELNVNTETIQLEVPGNPLLQIGMTVAVNEVFTDQVNRNYFLYGISSRMSGDGSYRSTLTLKAGNRSNGGKKKRPVKNKGPVAVLSYRQTIWGDPQPWCYADGSLSYSPSGLTITNYSFDWGDGSPVTSGAVSRANHHYDYSLLGQTFIITLTVTDSLGQTGVTKKSITIGARSGPGRTQYRLLYVANMDQLEGYVTLNGGQTWETVTFPASSYPLCVAVDNEPGEEGSSAVWGCNDGKIYQTTDWGGTPTLLKDTGDPVKCIWEDLAITDVIVAGCEGGAVWRSDDKGATWINTYTETGLDIWQIITDPSNPNIVYIGGGLNAGDGFYKKSIDGGYSFTDISGLELCSVVRDFAIQFFINHWVTTHDADHEAFESVDSGVTVSYPLEATTDLESITASPYDPGVAYAAELYGGGSAFYRTSASGGDFVQTLTTTSGSLKQCRVDGVYYDAIYGVGDGGLELSNDGGDTWKWLKKDATPANTYRWVAYGPLVRGRYPDTVWVASADGLWKFEDSVWTQYQAGTAFNDVAVNPYNYLTVMAVGSNNVIITRDGGLTWTSALPSDMGETTNFTFLSVEWNSSRPGECYLVGPIKSNITTGKRYFWKSTNYGASWTIVQLDSGFITVLTRRIKSHPYSSENLLITVNLSSGVNKIHRSTDAGATWSENNGPTNAANKYRISTMGTDGQTWIVNGDGASDEISRSTNNGATWTNVIDVNSNCSFVEYNYFDGSFIHGVIAGGATAGIHRTPAIGETTVETLNVNNMNDAVIVQDTGYCYACGNSGLVYMSRNGGLTWTRIDQSLISVDCYRVDVASGILVEEEVEIL